MVGTPYGGVVGWFHVGVRPWGFGCLVACCGFPCPLGLVGVCPLLCVGVIPLGWLSGCWWRVGSDACWSGWLSCVSVSWGGFLWRWLSGFACPVGGLLVGRLLGVVSGCSLLASAWWGTPGV